MRIWASWILVVSAAFADPCGEEEPLPAQCDYAKQREEAQKDCDNRKKAYCEGIGLVATCFTVDADPPPECTASCGKCDCSLGVGGGNPPIDVPINP